MAQDNGVHWCLACEPRTDGNDTGDNDGDHVDHDQCFILRGSNIHHDYFTHIISHVINNWPITTYGIRSKGN